LTTLGVLALIAAVGLLGPLLASITNNLAPIVVGEIVAGVVLGTSGTGTIDPAQPTLALLSDVGFATLMFAAGMNVPLHDPRLRSALGQGAIAAAVVAVLAVPAGLATAVVAGGGHGAIYAVILASSSAAIALPILTERGLTGGSSLALIAQITIADIACVVAVPFALQPSRAGDVILGSLAVVAATLAFFAGLRWLGGFHAYRQLREQSKQRGWALDLRIDLAALLGLAALAKASGTSILIAGFGAGLVVGALGGPERLSLEVRGIAQGFLVPLFFVLLGARLDVGSLVNDPSNLGLAAALAVLTVAVHVAGTIPARLPRASGLVSSAQMGVPAAVVSLGLGEGIISAGQGAAIIAAGLVSLGVCAVGAALLAADSDGRV
jgi:Kef-type K+ transport system membrane component KefB